MSEDRHIFSLKQVVSSIRKTIEDRYQSSYWVKAEMHKLNLYPSGHAFPELVQKEDGKIVAQINGSIWKQNFQRINQRFIEIVKEPVKEGTTLLLNVKVTFNETFGMSLQIQDIDPSYSLGELQKERQETLLKLKKEGLLNLNQQLDFPLLPQRIAIVSADTSKGLSDFMKVLNNNSSGFAFFTMLFTAYLQGNVASESIIGQLKRIKKVKQHFDVVVIVRGGGGEVGLSCYNNFELCKAIAEFELPVLTGIGHSTNLTVAEMIAFRNAITPTELGDFLIEAFNEVNIPVQNASAEIKRSSLQIMEKVSKNFLNETKTFKSNVKHSMVFHTNQLIQTSRKLHAKTDLAIDRNRERVNYIHRELSQSSKRFNQDKRVYLEDASGFLLQNSMQFFKESIKSLNQMERSIEQLNPQNVLKRGYSITRLNGKTISDTNVPKSNDELNIESYEYSLTAKMSMIEKKK